MNQCLLQIYMLFGVWLRYQRQQPNSFSHELDLWSGWGSLLPFLGAAGYKKFYSRELWISTVDLQIPLSFCFCPFSLSFHGGQDLIELQRNETEMFPSGVGDQNP